MLTASLTSREDLIEALDSEAIFDYLIQHGVLDEDGRGAILQGKNRVQRNTALLHHVEDTGSSAVALFINALRQSGQLHLASSLDVESRIKPTYGSGYLGKERYKGQVTVRVQLDSIFGFFPVWEEGDDTDEKHGDTPEKELRAASLDRIILTPRRAHKSYENMTMIGEPGSSRSWKIREYAYDYDSDDDMKKGFCWCFCRPRRRKDKKDRRDVYKPAKKKLEYKTEQIVQNKNASKTKLSNGNPRMPGGETSMSKSTQNYSKYVHSTGKVEQPIGSGVRLQGKPSVSSVKNGQVDTRVCYATTGDVSVMVRGGERRDNIRNSYNNRMGSSDSVEHKNSLNSKRNSQNSMEDKENTPPLHKNSNPKQTSPTKRQILKQNLENLRDSMKLENVEPVEFCEMWKGRGPTFNRLAEKYYGLLLDNNINMDIIKYFEQDRGTLVFQVCVEDCLVVCNICMTVDQVAVINEDVQNGSLLEVFESILLKRDFVDALNVKEVKLKVVINQEEITQAVQELS